MGGLDVVIDTDGGAVLDGSYGLLYEGGQLVTLGAPPDQELAARDKVRALFFVVETDVAIALCAFTAAGNDRPTAAGQWIRRASQQDLARLRAPWDPICSYAGSRI